MLEKMVSDMNVEPTDFLEMIQPLIANKKLELEKSPHFKLFD
jgi:hypothetical protein